MPILHWLTRDQDVRQAARVPYRLLKEVPDLSYGDQDTRNMLIQGDNLDTLKALLPYYAGKVKCIFTDPPYNTKSAFEHYDDNLEHSKWLSMMYPRLELLRELLAEDGSIWVTIDDNEAHYLKVIMDEIFGRKNFVASVAWQKVFAKKNKALISGSHDHILVFAKDISRWKRNLLPRGRAALSAFKNPDNDKRDLWQSVAYSVQSEDAERRKAYRYPIRLPSGREVMPPIGRHWNGLPDRTEELRADNRLWFGKKGDSPPRLKVFLSEVQGGIVPDTWWTHGSAGSNQDSKKEMLELFPDTEPFATPKPEKLIFLILTIATNINDSVLDSFLGSATTSAVAHKMGRRYIGIELGEHTETHCAPRLRKVVDGEQGGISKAVGWNGGGGFRFYRLGNSVFDEFGHLSPDIRFPHLAAHLWFIETGQPYSGKGNAVSPFLGSHEGTAYYLLYNGILGDKRPNGGNILTSRVLSTLPSFDGPKVVFGEGCRLSAERLKQELIIFRQIPYEIKAR
jgi:adenine-specific DNA-methyltransferase